ncbi:MAG: tRNA (adenosine(37)-N6)-dimethylallyltransferase MiaA [Chlamydiae bacterium]|nr:tRNA (adenosine(37)-N6)-dimethylallyltransferase MiaA [Chlamydiota bacterium]
MGTGITVEDKGLKKAFTHFPLSKKESIHPGTKKKKILVLAGPTGVGKTKRSLIIAHALGGEIISADSMQVYRGMDIGTAKVSQEDRKKIPHHLIDIKDLHERFNIVDFYHEAIKAIQEVLAKEHVPIIVGGTGFYIHALIYGPPKGPASVAKVRERLEEEMDKQGPKVLYERLQKLDPDYALTITPNDRHKIIRALEIMTITNQKVSHFAKSVKENGQYDFRCWFLYMPKELLYPILEMRCDEMIAKGFIDEVKELEKRGLRSNSSASQAIGYRQCLKFLQSPQSQEDFDEFVASFKQASRRYAKRQYTWFRKEPLFRWLNVDQMSLENSVEMIMQDYELK